MAKNTAYNLAISKHINANYFGGASDSLFGSKKKKAIKAAHPGITNKEARQVNRATNKLNKKSLKSAKKKAKLDATLDLVAQRDQKPKEVVALEYLQQPTQMQKMSAYVTEKGEAPLQNPAELATQAYMLRNDDIESISEQLDVPEEDAEYILDEAEEEISESFSGAADAFIGDILAAIAPVAKRGLAKIAEKKEAKGKNGLFAKAVKGLDKKLNPDGTPEKKTAQEIQDEIIAAQKKKEIQKMLPMIIGGVVALILITVLVTKYASKHK
jgi:hypothetical protein